MPGFPFLLDRRVKFLSTLARTGNFSRSARVAGAADQTVRDAMRGDRRFLLAVEAALRLYRYRSGIR